MVKISNVKLISSIIESIQKVTKNKKANNLHEPTLSKLEEKYLKKCLKTNMLSTIGPYINLFEKNKNLLSQNM